MKAARQHSLLMSRRNAVSHRFPGEPTLTERISDAGVHFEMTGENIALDGDAESAHMGLMHSPPHRANILNERYNSAGIGVVRVGNQIWVTQDFVRAFAAVSPEEAERTIAESFNKARRTSGTVALKVVPQAVLRDAACAMARSNRLSSNAPAGVPNVSTIVAFTTTDPSRLPDSLMRLRSARASGMSVGVCFASSTTYVNPVYWAVVVTYF